MGIGTLETHPIDLLSAYGTIANGGVLMPRQMITKVVDEDGKQVWPLDDAKPEGVEVISPQAAYIITDILAGNTVTKINPYWGKWAIYRDGDRAGRRPTRPARRATTATCTRTATSRRPRTTTAPALAVGVWMGNSDNAPEQRHPLARLLGAALVGDPDRGQRGLRDRPVQGRRRPRDRDVDAFTGLKPGPFTTKTVKELFMAGTVPTEQRDDPRRRSTSTRRRGLLWQDGCAGPKVTRASSTSREVESNFPTGRRRTRLGRPAARGPGVRGGPRARGPSYFYDGAFAPFGRIWGAPFAPTQKCPLAPPPDLPRAADPFGDPDADPVRHARTLPTAAVAAAAAAATADRPRRRSPDRAARPRRRPARSEARRSSPRRRPRRARRPDDLDQRVAAAAVAHRVAQGPGARARG